MDALTQSLPDAILLDLHMDVDGHETLTRIHDIHPNLPTIMLTGDTDLENVVKAMQAGACNYLGKPVERKKLLEVLEAAIKTYHQKFQVRYEERTASGTVDTATCWGIAQSCKSYLGTWNAWLLRISRC